MKQIIIVRRENNTFAFIETINGDVENAKEISLTPKQREEIEKVLNKN